jgi:regulator of replication initiation timing
MWRWDPDREIRVETWIWDLGFFKVRGTIPHEKTSDKGSHRMITKAAAARTTTDVEPIDRLEEKVKRLVELISQLRAEQARSADENARLAQEIASLRAKLADAETIGSEVSTLRDEREMIRARVAEMLEQLEAI